MCFKNIFTDVLSSLLFFSPPLSLLVDFGNATVSVTNFIYYLKIFLFKLVFRNKVICLVLTDTCAFKITMDTVTDAFLEILQIIVWPLKLLFGTAFSLEPLDYPTQFSFFNFC